MIIYADVLIFTNIIIDYVLLYLTQCITKNNCKLFRIVSAAFIGGVSSLYIFFEIHSILINFSVKTIVSLTIVSLAFGTKKRKVPITETLIYLILSFSFCGLILFLENLSIETFYLKNFTCYLNISPILLISLTIIFYIIIKIIFKIIDRKSVVGKVQIDITLFENTVKLIAIVDSGHTLTDPISDAQIIILDANPYLKLVEIPYDLSNRKRVIPIKTISDSCLLEGVRCDYAIVKNMNSEIFLKKPIILKSNQEISGDYDAIISNSIFTNN